MKRDRFKLILKFLHFNDNTTYNPEHSDRDRLHKVRPFLDILLDRFRNVYSPGKNLSVDESLVLFKGRLHFHQLIKTKCSRFGIKLYELTTSEGITLDVLVYCGKGMYYAEDNQYENMATTERIPVELMRPFLNRGHVLYTDNFYTSPNLAKFLLRNQTYLCGIIRNNPKSYCSTIKNVALQKSEATFYEGKFKDEENADAEIPAQRLLACKFRARQDKAKNLRLLLCFHLCTIQLWFIQEKWIRMKPDHQARNDQRLQSPHGRS